MLTVIDEYTRECLAIEVDRGDPPFAAEGLRATRRSTDSLN
jgi:hypothetical protein